MLAAAVAAAPIFHDGTLAASDGARLHFLDTGLPAGRTPEPALLLVPGWTMPASIWEGTALRLGRR